MCLANDSCVSSTYFDALSDCVVGLGTDTMGLNWSCDRDWLVL